MKIQDLFELNTKMMKVPYGGAVEVFENPSLRELHREIFNSSNMDGEYGARGFYVPDIFTESGRPFYAFWSANLLHPDVVEEYGYEYSDVIKFYVDPKNFVIYYFNNPRKTSNEIKELVGETNEGLVNHLKQVKGLKRIVSVKRVSFEDYA